MRVDRSWGSIHASVDGAGPPLVLLHPLALNAQVWRGAVESLRHTFRVIAVDARGHGESSWNGDRFTVEDLAEDVAAVVAEAGGPAHVLGMSMGGCTAIALAVRHPELVDRLVLVDTTADYGKEKGPTWQKRAADALRKPRAQQLPFQQDRWFSPWFLDEHPDELQRISEIFVSTDSHAHAAACCALGAYDDSNRLADISSPTLILVGDEDYATPPSMAEALHAGIAGSTLCVLSGTRHMSLIQNAGAWDLVLDHLSRGGTAAH